MSRGNSVSTVSDYRLDDRAINPRQRRKYFSSSLCVQIGSEAHQASCTMGTGGGCFPWGKAETKRDADHSLPSSDEVMND
jgi:hypothetical protein